MKYKISITMVRTYTVEADDIEAAEIKAEGLAYANDMNYDFIEHLTTTIETASNG